MKSMPVKEEVQDRTEEIYCKAAQIFHDHGYDATSMSDYPAKQIEDARERLRYIIQRHGGELIKGVLAIPILTNETTSLSTKLYFGGLLNCPTKG